MRFLTTLSRLFRLLFGKQPKALTDNRPQLKDGTWMDIVPFMRLHENTPVVVFMPLGADMRIVLFRGVWMDEVREVAIYEYSSTGGVTVDFAPVPEGAKMRWDLSTKEGLGRAVYKLKLVWERNNPQGKALRDLGFNPLMIRPVQDESTRCLVAEMLKVVAEAEANAA